MRRSRVRLLPPAPLKQALRRRDIRAQRAPCARAPLPTAIRITLECRHARLLELPRNDGAAPVGGLRIAPSDRDFGVRAVQPVLVRQAGERAADAQVGARGVCVHRPRRARPQCAVEPIQLPGLLEGTRPHPRSAAHDSIHLLAVPQRPRAAHHLPSFPARKELHSLPIAGRARQAARHGAPGRMLAMRRAHRPRRRQRVHALRCAGRADRPGRSCEGALRTRRRDRSRRRQPNPRRCAPG